QEQHEGGEKAVKARKKKILPAWGGGSGGGWL
ncbi:hypothetical protein, partial [Salmonella enterica]